MASSVKDIRKDYIDNYAFSLPDMH